MSISQTTISRQVGVSRSAVSHVLNGRGHMVSKDTREKILKAVEAAGYHRNALVHALKTNRTHVVGIVVPDTLLAFFGEPIVAAEREASARGMRCFLCQSHNFPEAVATEIAALREYRVDGVLVIPVISEAAPDVYQLMLRQKFPFALMEVPVPGIAAPYVGSDGVAAGRLAVDHLMALGHQHIACIRGYRGSPSAQDHFKGYCEAMRAAGFEPDDALIVGDGFEFEEGRKAVGLLLERGADFTAIVAPSDFAAVGAVQQLARHNLRVPADVSVIGCGNLNIAAMANPPLTTVDQKPQELGRVAMELLIDVIENGTNASTKMIMKPKLAVRESTAAVAHGSRL